MSSPSPVTEHFFRFACFFEAGLGVLAMALGWMLDVDPFAALHYSEPALLKGMLATVPVVLLFFVLQALPFDALRKIRQLLLETLGARLHRCHWSDLLVLSLIAGFSEELLFRGVLQPWLEQLSGLSAGLLLSNLIFALVHAVTALYALLAMLMGIYLGLSLDYGGERNLLIPITVHALYDFVAFVVILRHYRKTL